MPSLDDYKGQTPAWCMGCGNYGILNAFKKAVSELGIEPHRLTIVSGIGQAGKFPHYFKCNTFNGLHGRTLPVATGIRLANHDMIVAAVAGDGDCYGEGGNHFMHNIRRNVDITVVVHNNQVYGLTKGQASPTTDLGFKTKVQTEGVIVEPLHPLEMAIALGCGFVARGYSADLEHLSWLITEGIKYNGFSLIDVLQPCVTFNKKNTYEWYSKRVYKVNDDASYNFTDKMAAYKKAAEWDDKIPIGIIFKVDKQAYGEKIGINKEHPIVEEIIENIDIKPLLNDFV